MEERARMLAVPLTRVASLIAWIVAPTACVAHTELPSTQPNALVIVTFDSARPLTAVTPISAPDTVRRIVDRVLEVGGVARGYRGDTLVVDPEYLTTVDSVPGVGERARRTSAEHADILLVFIPQDVGVRLRYVTRSSTAARKLLAAGFILTIVAGTIWYVSRPRW